MDYGEYNNDSGIYHTNRGVYMDIQKLGAYLKKHRRKAGLTQERLAEIIDYTPSYISEIERGNREPKLDVLTKLMRELKIDPRDLFEECSRTPIHANHSLYSQYCFIGKQMSDEQLQRVLAIIELFAK